jgi:hypothetical protein
MRAVRADGWKLIWGSDGRHELFDVRADPGEAADVAATQPERVRTMTALLGARLSRLAGRPFSLDAEPPPAEVGGFLAPDAAIRDRLRSLGYVR